MKQRIQEVIVVEGHHDSEHLKRFYDCVTIETHGLGLNRETIQRIQRAKETTGVIVFTDPDSPGNRIRNKINEAVPGCKNAYLLKEEARTDRKVGIEHAPFPALEKALSHLVTMRQENKETITNETMVKLGLVGEGSVEKRHQVAKELCIGFSNAKTMRKRLNALGIKEEKLAEILNG